MTARPEADSKIVGEEDDGVWGWSPQRFMSRVPFGRYWGKAPPPRKLNTFTYLNSQFCPH